MGDFFNIRTGQTLTESEYYNLIKDVDYTCCDFNNNVWISGNIANTDYGWQLYFNQSQLIWGLSGGIWGVATVSNWG